VGDEAIEKRGAIKTPTQLSHHTTTSTSTTSKRAVNTEGGNAIEREIHRQTKAGIMRISRCRHDAQQPKGESKPTVKSKTQSRKNGQPKFSESELTKTLDHMAEIMAIKN